MSRVCRRLGELADDHSLAFHLASNNLHCVYAAAERVEAQLQLLTRQPDGLAASDRQRFDFLVDTLGHLRSVTQPLAEQLEQEVAAVAGDAAADCRATHKSEAALALGRLLKTLHRLLLELVTFLRVDLETLRQQRRSDAELLHDHFDSFDLAIRRHACQITALFPAPDFLRRPSSIIQDERARDIWNSNFGAGCYAVPFRRFYTEVIRRLVKPEYLDRKDFINSLTYFINFPNDDMITPYKWHLLTRLFGPVADLSANFANIVMQPGFVGLVNRIRAEELLRDYCCQMNAPVYLLRFSRTATEYLVVSTILPSHGGSQLCHRLINMANWKNATLVDAVRQSTRGYKRLPMAVDGQAIVKLESLSSLARSASAYGYVTYSLCDID